MVFLISTTVSVDDLTKAVPSAHLVLKSDKAACCFVAEVAAFGRRLAVVIHNDRGRWRARNDIVAEAQSLCIEILICELDVDCPLAVGAYALCW